MAFEIGDKVIYPNHGLGVIERIETKTIMGTTCGFYQLRMANETTVFVPVDNVEGVGLRRAISDAEVERLFTLLADGNIDSHQNWKGRFKDNSDRMRTGSIYDVVEVLKSLAFLARSKSLSFREKRMLDRAKFLVVSEITEVLSMSTEEVERRVDEALEKCFALKAELDARPRPAAAAKAPEVEAEPAPEEPAVAAVEPEPAPAPAVRSAAAKTARTAAKTTKVAAKAKPAAARRTAKAATTRSKASAARKTGGKATTTRRAARAS
ncbi:MAG: CarD family transcriptional regulator [Acidobacteriota bacterium]